MVSKGRYRWAGRVHRTPPRTDDRVSAETHCFLSRARFCSCNTSESAISDLSLRSEFTKATAIIIGLWLFACHYWCFPSYLSLPSGQRKASISSKGTSVRFWRRAAMRVIAQRSQSPKVTSSQTPKMALLRGGKSGVPAIVPGKPEESLLIKAIQGAHKDLKMPPGKPLPAEQVQAFVDWVKMGAPDPRTGTAPVVEKPAYDWNAEKKHWAYQPVRDPQPPEIADARVEPHRVDRFIKAKLDEKGLPPLARASKRTSASPCYV